MDGGEDTQVNEGQVEPYPQADGEQFEMYDIEDRDRDYQVCPVVLPLNEI